MVFSRMNMLVCIPTNSVQWSCTSLIFIIFCLLDNNHSTWGERIPYCAYDLHFPDDHFS
jgi:hypothetical protein